MLMNLLFVIPEYPPQSGGGIATFYRHFLPELARQGHQVHAIVGSALSGSFPSYAADGITVEALDANALGRNLIRFDRYRALPELQRHLAAAWTAWEQTQGGTGYDLVETSDWGLLFVPWIASSHSPPTIVQLHASIGQIDFYDPQTDNQLQGGLVRLIEADLLTLADELQTYGQANGQTWQQRTQREVRYIPPPLAMPLAGKAVEPSTHGLVVGRIQYWKGPTTLCEAMQIMGNAAPSIDWLGRDTVYQEAGISMATHLQHIYPAIWGNKIKPIGTLPPRETQQLQAKAAFVIVPSIWDVFNLTAAEAMSQGQVVLCSEGAGAASLIADGVNGFTFAANDPAALAQSLEKILELSSDEKIQIGTAARLTIQTRLSPEDITQQRIQAYEKLIQIGKFPHRPHDWLLNAVCPSAPLDKPLAFLDRLPLKELSRYVVNRSLKKLMRSIP
jgi:glycosyltransferase involved in cell wall biosynthesis